MRDAAIILVEKVDSIDVNMGCPVPKVTKTGGKSDVDYPKLGTHPGNGGCGGCAHYRQMRLGWDDQNLTAPDLARALEDAGVAAICTWENPGTGI